MEEFFNFLSKKTKYLFPFFISFMKFILASGLSPLPSMSSINVEETLCISISSPFCIFSPLNTFSTLTFCTAPLYTNLDFSSHFTARIILFCSKFSSNASIPISTNLFDKMPTVKLFNGSFSAFKSMYLCFEHNPILSSTHVTII